MAFGPCPVGLVFFRMIKKIKKIYKPEYMNRPVVHKVYSKFLIIMVLCLAWERFVDQGERGIDYVFTIMGLLMLIVCWFNYLKLDDFSINHLMKGWQKKKRNVVSGYRDIADFTDEEIVDFAELEKDEKAVVRFFSNIIVAVLYLLLAVIVPLFL